MKITKMVYIQFLL